MKTIPEQLLFSREDLLRSEYLCDIYEGLLFTNCSELNLCPVDLPNYNLSVLHLFCSANIGSFIAAA
jgi:hypothetical protein